VRTGLLFAASFISVLIALIVAGTPFSYACRASANKCAKAKPSSGENLMPDDFCRFETPKIKSVRSRFEKDESSLANAHSVLAS